MIDSFPYDSWFDAEGNLSADVTTFWTFAPTTGSEGGSLTGTFVLTALGILLMVASIVAWTYLENKKLSEQAERLRSAGLN